MTKTVDENVGDTQRFIGIMVTGTEYAVEIKRVREVRALEHVTRVPGAPSHMRGLMEVHGDAVPVIDLRIRLSTGAQQGKEQVVLFVETQVGGKVRTVGLQGDVLSRVHQVADDDLSEIVERSENAANQFARALLRSGESLVVVLDIDLLLDTRCVSPLKRKVA